MNFSGICRTILYRWLGWSKHVTIAHPDKYIICLAPHTSNWDFVIAQLYMRAEPFHSNFLMKKEWFFWPLGKMFRRMGGIPVYRDSSNTNMTSMLIHEAQKHDIFALTITPEGTRKLNANWKKGFYYIAKDAGIPILLYALDFEKKQIVCTEIFHPTGDVDADMSHIKEYYKDVKAKYPEKFKI